MMHRCGMLPLSYWGLGRGPKRKQNHDTDVIQRIGMSMFFGESAGLVPSGAVCLEWGAAHYTKLVPACGPVSTWQFAYSRGQPSIDRVKVRRSRRVVGLTSTLVSPSTDVASVGRRQLLSCDDHTSTAAH